jgi:hypothetical protein
MTAAAGGGAIPDLDRMASLLAVALSQGRRGGAVIDSGPSQAFQTDLRLITVPAGPPLAADDPLVLACGVALQCAPSKEDAVRLRWWELPRRQRGALAWAEGEAAARWVSETWPGLATTIGALFPWVGTGPVTVDSAAVDAPGRRTDRRRPPELPALFGVLPAAPPRAASRPGRKTVVATPWTTRENNPRHLPDSIPVNGTGGEDVLAPGLADGLEALDGRRLRLLGTPYDEWDAHRRRYRRDWVRVVELPGEAPGTPGPAVRVPPIEPTRTRQRRQWDGDVDIDAVVAWRCDLAAGDAGSDTRLFTSLAPDGSPAVWCLLVDGSASSWAGGGQVFRRALACADATASALSARGQAVGVFAFRSFSRERVEIRLLKGYDDPYRPLGPGPRFRPDGYTRLGAAIRHTGRRLRQRPGAAHVLLSFGDALASDEGYDGAYARADVAKAVDEQRRAGTLVSHVAVAAVEAGRLDEMFGPGGWAPATGPTDLAPVLATVAHTLRRPM